MIATPDHARRVVELAFIQGQWQPARLGYPLGHFDAGPSEPFSVSGSLGHSGRVPVAGVHSSRSLTTTLSGVPSRAEPPLPQKRSTR